MLQLTKNTVIFISFLFLSHSILLAGTKILILGDSLSAGFHIAEKDSYPKLLEEYFQQQKMDVEILNASISGSTSSSGLKRLKFALRAKPDVLVLALGANDGLRGQNLKVMQKNLRQIIQLAQKKKMKVLLVGMRIPPNYGKSYSKKFFQSFNLLAKKYKTHYMPFLLKDVGGRRMLNLNDGLHPNAKGQIIMFRNILPYLTALLEEQQ